MSTYSLAPVLWWVLALVESSYTSTQSNESKNSGLNAARMNTTEVLPTEWTTYSLSIAQCSPKRTQANSEMRSVPSYFSRQSIALLHEFRCKGWKNISHQSSLLTTSYHDRHKERDRISLTDEGFSNAIRSTLMIGRLHSHQSTCLYVPDHITAGRQAI